MANASAETGVPGIAVNAWAMLLPLRPRFLGAAIFFVAEAGGSDDAAVVVADLVDLGEMIDSPPKISA